MSHTPVLVERCRDLVGLALSQTKELACNKRQSQECDVSLGEPPVYVDATLGMGGHAEAILEAYEDIHLVGIDRDPHALEQAKQRLEPFHHRCSFFHTTADALPAVLSSLRNPPVVAVLFDLGISSLQIDSPERGFSYSHDVPLDMRMNPEDPLTAADILNTYSEAEIARILKDFGEERFARKIARVVVQDRVRTPWETSGQLVAMLQRVIPDSSRRAHNGTHSRRRGGKVDGRKPSSSHPAKRTFQALRIAVNGELDSIARAVPAALDALCVGGICIVESYQSLEDALVKRIFTEVSSVQAPPDLPVVPMHLEPWGELVSRRAECASEQEISANPRSASVRLRALCKTRSPESTLSSSPSFPRSSEAML